MRTKKCVCNIVFRFVYWSIEHAVLVVSFRLSKVIIFTWIYKNIYFLDGCFFSKFGNWKCTHGIKGDVTRDDSQGPLLGQHSVAISLRHCFEWLQHCSSIATLCCAKNRRWMLLRTRLICSEIIYIFFEKVRDIFLQDF